MDEYIARRIIEVISLLGLKNKVVREHALTEKGFVQIKYILKKLGLDKKHKVFLNFIRELSMARVSTELHQLYKVASQVDVVKKFETGYYEGGEE